MLKKKFFDVELENLNLKISVLARDINDLKGKTITYDLTRILKGKNCEAKFRVKELQEGVPFAEIYSFVILPTFIRKMIGRNISIVEDSFFCKCQDAGLRIKPFLITRKKVHRRIRAFLREKARDFIMKSVSEMSRKKFFQEILSSSLQKNLSKKLKKIYPLAVCEIRMAKVEK
ncbi:MAG: hypothetical protein QXP53_01415 [Candidatus Pacearchaeota archaeon]